MVQSSPQKPYAYINARVRAMRAGLVTDGEYRKLLKMDLPEVAEFLGKRGYGEEMEELGADYEGEELVERALRSNLSRTYRKLVRVSPPEVRELLRTYFRKFDIENLKVIARKKLRGSEEDTTWMLVPTEAMDRQALDRLSEAGSVHEMLERVPLPGFSDYVEEHVSDAENLQELEDAMDSYHYTRMLKQARQTGGSARFRKFLELEASLKDVALILRLKRRGYDRDDVMERLVPVPEIRQVVNHEELAGLDEQELVDRLKDSKIGEYIEEDTPGQIEKALEKYKLKQGIRMMHQDPLGLNPVLGFMVCKEMEAQNLRTISRAKAEGLDEEFMKRNIVRGVAS